MLFRSKTADHATTMKMLKDIIFPRFGVPRFLITDGGSHFIHGVFRKALAKYDFNHRIASPYHPQTQNYPFLMVDIVFFHPAFFAAVLVPSV